MRVAGIDVCLGLGAGSPLEFLYHVFYLSFYSIIPFCIIPVLNILIVKKIDSEHRFRSNHQNSKDTRTKNLTITMLAVCTVFAITTIPTEILFFMHLVSKLLGTNLISNVNIILKVTYQLDHINHSINFLLYCLTGSIFRQTLVRLFQSCRKQNSQRNIEVAGPTIEAQVSSL